MYVNRKTGVRIDLSQLNEKERRFYEAATARYRVKPNWLEFQAFAFGMDNPAFAPDRSHADALTHPLYLALRDMFLQLGVTQGKILRKSEAAKCREEAGAKARVVRRHQARPARR